MGKIIWLASYPKSGNTWLRVLLTNYLSHTGSPADINKLEGGPIASARSWFDEWAGVEASVLDNQTIERLRPGVYRCLARESPDTLFMKAHDAWKHTDRAEGLFPADITQGVVYIVRNPLDLVASCAHHWGVSLEQAADRLCDPQFFLGRSLGGLADQLRQELGSWSGHVHSWLVESELNVHVVCYEELRADPEGAFSEVVRFCGLPLDSAQVSKAVAFSQFGELARQEQEKGFRERPGAGCGPFFRRGQAGSWRDELPVCLAQKILAAHGAAMSRFGYIPGDFQR